MIKPRRLVNGVTTQVTYLTAVNCMEVRFSTIVTRGFLRRFAKILWDQGSCRFIYLSLLMKYVPWMISKMIVEGDRIPRAKKLYILVQK